MNEKELKKLGRRELLEILIAQSGKIERLQQELAEANRKLSERTILLKEAGNIAQAALKLNGIFEAAQSAADQYLASIREASGTAEVTDDEG